MHMNKKLKRKIFLASILGGSILTTGCNYNLIDTKYTFDKAVIYNDSNALIVDIDTWTDYDGEQLQVTTDDGTVLIVSSFNTILIKEDDLNANDIAISLVGEDGEVYYWDSDKKTKVLVNK